MSDITQPGESSGTVRATYHSPHGDRSVIVLRQNVTTTGHFGNEAEILEEHASKGQTSRIVPMSSLSSFSNE